MGPPLSGIPEYMLVQERFALAEQAYAAVKAAHRRGNYSGPERDHLRRAVNGVREAARAFRQVRALEDHSGLVDGVR